MSAAANMGFYFSCRRPDRRCNGDGGREGRGDSPRLEPEAAGRRRSRRAAGPGLSQRLMTCALRGLFWHWHVATPHIRHASALIWRWREAMPCEECDAGLFWCWFEAVPVSQLPGRAVVCCPRPARHRGKGSLLQTGAPGVMDAQSKRVASTWQIHFAMLVRE